MDMYGLETIHAMNAQTPGELAAKRVEAVKKYAKHVEGLTGSGNSPTAFVMAKTILRILRRRKFD
jgi:hypothetical protein